MSRSGSQRPQSYQVFNEVYHTSNKQQEVRKELTYCVKTRLDHQLNSKFARMSTILLLDPEMRVRVIVN